MVSSKCSHLVKVSGKTRHHHLSSKTKYKRLDNQLKGNGDKYHVLLSTKEKVATDVDSAQIENSHSEKLFEVIIDNELSFGKQIKTLCGKAR